ncbi:MAG: ATP-binding protein [Ilumatobacteraceae bacterium]
MKAEQSISLAPVAASARAARLFVRLFLADPVPPTVAEIAVLLTSELVTNAFRHAGPHRSSDQLVLHVTSTAERVRVEVDDHSVALPTVDDRAFDMQSRRGMVLVNSLSSTWGVEAGPDGKKVWFAIDL